MASFSSDTTQRLDAAFSYPFAEPLTAFLSSSRIIAAACVGVTHRHVKADGFGQFQDGHRVCTSDICSVSRVGSFWCVRTLSGSLYVIVTFCDEGGEASLDTFLSFTTAGLTRHLIAITDHNWRPAEHA